MMEKLGLEELRYGREKRTKGKRRRSDGNLGKVAFLAGP